MEPVVWPIGMVMVSPLVSVTMSGLPVTGVATVTVSVIGWPSATSVETVRVTGVGLLTSVTAVRTGVASGSSSSNWPPSTVAMLFSTDALPLRVSFFAMVTTLPSVWPTGMVMVSPFSSVTTSGVPVTAVGTDAV
jgi:hypothetical protein